MTLEQLVLDLATSQKLRDAGFPQDTALAWYPEHCDDYEAPAPSSLWPDEWKRIAEGIPVVCVREEMEDHESLCAAPTAGELEEWLRTKRPNASMTITSCNGDVPTINVDIDDDVEGLHKGVGQYRALVAAFAALVLDVAG